eukprot:6453990-Prymnesium_polylepis.1
MLSVPSSRVGADRSMPSGIPCVARCASSQVESSRTTSAFVARCPSRLSTVQSPSLPASMPATIFASSIALGSCSFHRWKLGFPTTRACFSGASCWRSSSLSFSSSSTIVPMDGAIESECRSMRCLPLASSSAAKGNAYRSRSGTIRRRCSPSSAAASGATSSSWQRRSSTERASL